MKKFFFLIPATILLGCSTDSDEIKDEVRQEQQQETESETENDLPGITIESFAIDEHSEAGSIIGTISATDSENDQLTFTIDSDSGLEIDEETGELTLGANLVLDYEDNQSISFTISVFDGKAIVDQNFKLTINDINEYDLLSDEQQETIAYYQYLTLWQAPTGSPIENSSRWMEPMKLYLDGQITVQFKADVESILEEYNVIFESSDFNISLVETLEESNAHLFFGETGDIEGLWADMFEIIDGKTFAGYAITSNNNSVLSNTRMWVSNPIPVLFKHEMGHALGFGHSEKCDTEDSFMCSSIDADHNFLEIEKEILSYAYANDMAAGLTAQEIEAFLANKMILEE
jgi:hypothetical protein